MNVFKILKWIILAPIFIIVIWGIGRFLFCGPDKSILKITDPLAKEIVTYINTHGRPKSLADIQGLSYKVEKCKRLKTDSDNEYNEKCFIKTKERIIEVEIFFALYDGVIRTVGIHFKDYNNNVKSDYRFVKKVDKKLYLEDSYIDTIYDSFFCKNGYLKVG